MTGSHSRPAYYGNGSDFLLRVGMGLEADNGWTAVNMGGSREDITDGDIIKNWGGADYTYPPTGGEAMEVVGPAGLTTLMLIRGLGPGLVMQDFVAVPLTGDTPIALPGTWSRITELRNIGTDPIVGSNVIVRPAGGGVSYAEATPGLQRSNVAIFTVPTGFRAQFLSVSSSMQKVQGNDGSVTMRINSRQATSTVEVGEFGFGLQSNGNTTALLTNAMPIAAGGIDLLVRAGSSANGTIDVAVRVVILLSEDAKLVN